MSNSGEIVTIPSPLFSPHGAIGYWMVVQKFQEAKEFVEENKELFQNYIGALEGAIDEYSPPAGWDALNIALPVTPGVNFPPVPSFLDLELKPIPDTIRPRPELTPLPVLDYDVVLPDKPKPSGDYTVDYTDGGYFSEIWSPLVSRLLYDLANGGTGFVAEVESAMVARARELQRRELDNAYTNAVADFSARGFTLPPISMQGAINKLVAEMCKQATDHANAVFIKQAELEQSNNQFIMATLTDLEKVLRGHYDAVEGRKLDAAKAMSTAVIAFYAESMKAYVAEIDALAGWLRIRVEYIKAITEENNAKVAAYEADIKALIATIQATEAYNNAIIEERKLDVSIFDVSVRAEIARLEAETKIVDLEIEKARIEMEVIVAQIKASIDAYVSVNGLKERLAEGKANVAVQAVAAGWNAVNTSISHGFSSGESLSESVSHGDDLGESHTYDHSDA
jgi:hypothetical protein